MGDTIQGNRGKLVTSPDPVNLSLVLPCYNEARNITKVLQEWIYALRKEVKAFEIVIINDGSTDGTGRVLDQLRKEFTELRIIHQLHAGYNAAIRRGIELARGYYILHINSATEQGPKDFLLLWEKRNHFDLIIANGLNKPTSVIQKLGDWVLRRVVKALFGISVQQSNACFRLLNRELAMQCVPYLPIDCASTHLLLGILMYKTNHGRVTQLPISRRSNETSGRAQYTALSIFSGLLLIAQLIRLRLKLIHLTLPDFAPTCT